MKLTISEVPVLGSALQFPSPLTLGDAASENLEEGLLATGGDLSLERLILAYSQGIFPWYNQGEPIAWWSPSPRPILRPQALHIPRSLAKFSRNHPYKITSDKAFAQVIESCSQEREEGTWLSIEMKQAYIKLFEAGYGHSIEVWENQTLVGGLYGLALGQGFYGESMFTRVSNASKLALVSLCEHLARNDYLFLDCQLPSHHLEQFGPQLLTRKEFLGLLQTAQVNEGHPGKWGTFIHRPRS